MTKWRFGKELYEYHHSKSRSFTTRNIYTKHKKSVKCYWYITVGNYDHVETKGYWRPLNEAIPYDGEKNEISFGSECKLEFKCEYSKITETKKIIKEIHPYEEP